MLFCPLINWNGQAINRWRDQGIFAKTRFVVVRMFGRSAWSISGIAQTVRDFLFARLDRLAAHNYKCERN